MEENLLTQIFKKMSRENSSQYARTKAKAQREVGISVNVALTYLKKKSLNKLLLLEMSST